MGYSRQHAGNTIIFHKPETSINNLTEGLKLPLTISHTLCGFSILKTGLKRGRLHCTKVKCYSCFWLFGCFTCDCLAIDAVWFEMHLIKMQWLFDFDKGIARYYMYSKRSPHTSNIMLWFVKQATIKCINHVICGKCLKKCLAHHFSMLLFDIMIHLHKREDRNCCYEFIILIRCTAGVFAFNQQQPQYELEA